MGGRDFRARMTPKGVKKQGFQTPRERAYMPPLCSGKTYRTQKTADEAAHKQIVCQNRGSRQTAWEGVISGAGMTPKEVKKQGFQRHKQNACQHPGKIQTAWEDIISGARMTPKGINKQGFQRPKERA